MDPNQTVRTTPSRVNDIDPIGSESRTETIPTGLTGANARPEQPRCNESLRSGLQVKIDLLRSTRHRSQNESELES
ncbi:hypothetical protein F2Q70_00042533 [Brassica cretica]|uniref:Uncharacterized protein n=1 Tax=Brassica cretica TaxID=69181 RepID=A0A3N6T217_BRACR|nr:hypothetical protein F2Q70_00042533 [Brassica cretica]KAF3516900.1 hypothetical protein DY000_02058878 [Brassica cretica]